jgi:hypothetical protein
MPATQPGGSLILLELAIQEIIVLNRILTVSGSIALACFFTVAPSASAEECSGRQNQGLSSFVSWDPGGNGSVPFLLQTQNPGGAADLCMNAVQMSFFESCTTKTTCEDADCEITYRISVCTAGILQGAGSLSVGLYGRGGIPVDVNGDADNTNDKTTVSGLSTTTLEYTTTLGAHCGESNSAFFTVRSRGAQTSNFGTDTGIGVYFSCAGCS